MMACKAAVKAGDPLTPAEIEAIALAHPQVVPHLGGQAPKKVIVVPGRIVNLVV